MKYFDIAKQTILFNWNRFLLKLPFEGNIPDLTRPENYNKFKRELKNYLFKTEEKERIKQEAESELKKVSKGNVL